MYYVYIVTATAAATECVYTYNIIRRALFSILIPRFINFVRRRTVVDEPITYDLRIAAVLVYNLIRMYICAACCTNNNNDILLYTHTYI